MSDESQNDIACLVRIAAAATRRFDKAEAVCREAADALNEADKELPDAHQEYWQATEAIKAYVRCQSKEQQ